MKNLLPAGWATVSLGDICVKRVLQAPPTEDPVPYIDISAIDRNTKRIGETRLVSANDAPTRARQWVRARDVLVSMTRPNLNAVAQVHEDLDGAVASTGFDVLRPVGVLPEWVFYRVRSNEFVSDVCEDLQGVVYPAIRPHDVRRHRLPVPPEGEQRRIVEAIESYFTRLDDAVATLERVQRNLKRYRTAVLRAAVEGRLVPTEAELARAEGRDYEPATVLLERILAERRRRWEEAELAKMQAKGKTPSDDKWKAKYTEPLAPDEDSLPELPEGWCWSTVDQLALDVRYGSSAKTDPELTSGIPVLRMGNIADGTLSFTDLKYLPADHPEFPDLLLEPGDILFNRTNSAELVGKTAVFRAYTGQCSWASYLIRVRCIDGVQPDFVAQYVNSFAGRAWIASVVSQQVGQANVNGTKLKACAVPLPPLVEQIRIVVESERLLSLASRLAVDIQTEQSRCARLRQSILKWAFEGRLVDQDPTDEPASQLLERIQAERESKPAQSSRSRHRAPSAKDRL